MSNEQRAPVMKTQRDGEAASRREFLRGGLRYALLAGVGTAIATVVGKQRAVLPGQTCVSNGLCRGCAVVVGCGLPQALSFKLSGAGFQPATRPTGFQPVEQPPTAKSPTFAVNRGAT